MQKKDTRTAGEKKKKDPSTYTAYGDPVQDNSPLMKGQEKSPILEKAKQDGNVVKGEL